MLISRMQTSCKLFREKFDATEDIMIVSGGQVEKGPGVPTEAKVMKSLAEKEGVLSKCIVMEDKSRSTYDNGCNCKDILDFYGIGTVTVITSEFHMERSKMIFDS